jgi:hypothetical protein
VYLPGKHQFRCLETAPDSLAVAVNPIRRVTDAEADIERAIRRPAAAVSTGEHRMPEFRKIFQVRKLQTGNTVAAVFNQNAVPWGKWF